MPTLPKTDIRALLQDAQAFGWRFPSAAPLLARPLPEPGTERLIEGVAYLAGTILDRIRDFRQGAHEQLAERACPWLLRPIPSATILAFDRACEVPRWSGALRPSPFQIQETRVRVSPSGSSLELRLTAEVAHSAAALESSAFYVDGELQEALEVVRALSGCVELQIAAPSWSGAAVIDAPRVERCGLEPEAALAPDPDGPPAPFSSVTDAFVFPHKFRFVRVPALSSLRSHPATQEIRLTFKLPAGARLPSRAELRLDCAPVRNLFEAFADPLPLAFDSLPTPLRVPDGQAYGIREVVAIRPGELPSPVPDLRRLTATPEACRAPAMFAAAWNRQGELCASFVPTERTRRERVHGVASLRVLATSGRGGEVRTGDLRGDGFRNVVPGSRYVPPPTGPAFALRASRSAAVRGGRGALLDALREALLLSVPSWVGDDEWVRSMHARVTAIENVEVGVARRQVASATVLGYRYVVRVDETPFQSLGELDLFGAAIAEGVSRSLPARTFVEVHLQGLKTQCHLRHGTSEVA